MWFSVLEIVQKASVEMGLGKPALAVSNAEPTTLQMVGLLESVGEELATNYEWSFLIKTHTFTTVVGQSTYDLPLAFMRFKRDECDTVVEERMGRQVVVPNKFKLTRCDTDEVVTAAIVGNRFVFDVAPTAATEYEFDYLANTWVIDGNTRDLKTTFTQDSDKQVFNDRLIINGLKLKFKEVNGFATANAAYDFERLLESELNSDVQLKSLSLVPGRTNTEPNIPYSNWTV